jgi:hypothetical protein
MNKGKVDVSQGETKAPIPISKNYRLSTSKKATKSEVS